MYKTILQRLAFFYIFLQSFTLLGQSGGVEGIVIDDNNEPLPYVNILVLGQGTGAQSDDFGNFKIPLQTGNNSLVFSYLGYNNDTVSFDIKANEFEQIKMVLKEEATLLDQVVISGSRYEKPLGKVTVSLDVIPPSLIENSNNVTLEHSVDKVPGVNIVDGQANIRGGSGFSYGAGSRVLLLLDDMPILTGDSGFPYWELIPVETIGQVEILKGASSALYGSSALNGVINVRTAYPTSEPKTKVSFFNGITQSPRDPNAWDIDTLPNGVILVDSTTSKDWWKTENQDTLKWYEKGPPNEQGLSLSHSQKFGLWDVIGGMYLYNMKSWRQTEYERRARFTLKTRYRFAEKSPWTVGLGFNFQKLKSSTFFLWNGDGSEGYRTWESVGASPNDRFQMVIDPFIKYVNNNSRHELKMRYYYSNNETDRDQDLKTNLLYADYQYQYRFPFGGVLTTGLAQNTSWSEASLYGGRKFAGNNIAAYLQWDQEISPKLNASAGFRYELNRIGITDSCNTETELCLASQDWESKPVFRLGLNYQLAEYSFLRASYGQGYRFPTIAEKFVDTQLGTLTIGGNSDLQSETGWSTEIGLKQGVKVSNWKGYVDVAGFWTEYQDMMEFVFGQTVDGVGFRSVNTGNTRITGGEITLVGKGNIGKVSAEVLTGFTKIKPIYLNWNDATKEASSDSTKNVLKYRFTDTFKGDIQFKYNRFSFGVSGRYNSFMEAIDRIFVSIEALQLREARADNPNGAWVFDTRFAWHFNDQHSVSLLIDNVMNNEYVVRPAMYEQPRNFTVKYSFQM